MRSKHLSEPQNKIQNIFNVYIYYTIHILSQNAPNRHIFWSENAILFMGGAIGITLQIANMISAGVGPERIYYSFRFGNKSE